MNSKFRNLLETFILRKDFQNTIIYLGASILASSFSFLTLPYFTKYLTPEEYGIWGYLLALNSFILPLFILSLNSYYIKTYYDYNTKNLIDENQINIDKKILFSSMIWFCLSWTFFIITLLILFGNSLFQSLGVSIPFYPYAALMIVSNIAYPIAAFLPLQYRMEKKAIKFSFVTLLNTGLILVLSIGVMNMFEDKLLGRIWGYTIGQVLFILFCIPLLKKYIVFKVNISQLITGLKICLPLILPAFISVSYSFLDRVILEQYTTLDQLGYYNIALQYASVIWMVMLALYKTFEPTIFELSSKKNLKKIEDLIIGIYLFISIIGAALILASNWLIPLLTNGLFNDSIFLSQVLIISFILCCGSTLINTYLISIFKTKVLLYLSIIGVVIFILSSVLLVPIYGSTGIGIGRIILYVSLILIAWAFMEQKKYFIKFIAVSLIIPFILSMFLYF